MNRGKRSEIPLASIWRQLSEPGTHKTMCSSVHWAEGQVGRQHLPDHLGLKPHIRLRAADLDVSAWSTCQFERVEFVVELLQDLLGEASTDLADGLEVLRVGIVAGEKEGTVPVCALALAVVGAYHYQVERVAHS